MGPQFGGRSALRSHIRLLRPQEAHLPLGILGSRGVKKVRQAWIVVDRPVLSECERIDAQDLVQALFSGLHTSPFKEFILLAV